MSGSEGSLGPRPSGTGKEQRAQPASGSRHRASEGALEKG